MNHAHLSQKPASASGFPCLLCLISSPIYAPFSRFPFHPSLSLRADLLPISSELTSTPENRQELFGELIAHVVGLAATGKEPALADLVTLLADAYQEAAQGKQAEWVLISRLGVGLKKLAPDFQTKSYGYKDLSSLVLARTDLFENRRQNSKGKQLEVRLRKQAEE